MGKYVRIRSMRNLLVDMKKDAMVSKDACKLVAEKCEEYARKIFKNALKLMEYSRRTCVRKKDVELALEMLKV